MKKIAFLALALALPLLSIAQPHSVRKAFRQYAHEEGVTKITIPGILIDVASWFVDDKETARLIRKVDKVKILAIDGNEYQGQGQLAKDILDNFKSNSFEQLLTVRGANENAAILIKEGIGNKRELLIIAGDEGDNAVVYLKGRIVPEMLAEINKELKINTTAFKDI
jgi:hypothetical protein